MSRDLDDLEPETKSRIQAWLQLCQSRGVDVLVYCTLRTAEEQAELYARGRTKPGPKVTNAAPWQSWHQYGRAVDAVPIVHGKPIWKYNGMRYEWQVFADEARHVGLEWSGDWRRFKEYVHVHFTGGLTLAQAYRAARGAEPEPAVDGQG